MTAFLALFRDAWRRARDRKTVAVLLAIGLVFALFCASLEFGRPIPRESLHQQLTHFSIAGRPTIGGAGAGAGFRITTVGELMHPLVVTSRGPEPEDDLPQGLANVAVAEVEVQDLPEFDRLARTWRASSDGKGRKSPPNDVDGAPLTPREREEFIAGVLREHGWETVIARPHGEDDAHFLIAAATDHLAELEGVWSLSLLFRAFSVQMPPSTPAEVAVQVELCIADTFVGFVGMLIFLAAFCGAVPDLLQKGSLDLVLARPVGRARVLLFTYFGAVVTVLFVSATIFAACSLALGLRSGCFSFALVGCSLTAAAVFAMLYPVAMLFGLISRNANLAMVASIGFWGLAATTRTLRLLPLFDRADATNWKRLLDVVYWIAPKTSEMGLLDLTMLGKMQLSPPAYARLLEAMPQEVVIPDWRLVAGTSALFAGLVLALTIAIFRRRDV